MAVIQTREVKHIMNKLVRFNTMNLFDEVDRMFAHSFPAPRFGVANNFALAIDVTEHEDGYAVKASVPGINPDDVEITLDDNILTIKGETKAEEVNEGEKLHVRERRYGSFSRSIRFPVAVNSDDVNATYENGVLTLSVPKAEEVKPKRIAIQAS